MEQVFKSLRGTNNWKRPDRNQQHCPRPSGEGVGHSSELEESEKM